jgi:predicted membrane protein (TIGR00267 family)
MIGAWLGDPRNRLDIVAGLIDGILTALTLAAGKVLHHGDGLSLSLVGKVSAVGACTTIFVFFVAHYSGLRAELVHAERELSLARHGRFATTRLGQQVLWESALGAVTAACCSLIGSIIPLLLALLLPGLPLLAIGLTVALLGVLGALLAWSIFGQPLIWAVAMMAGGIVFALIGATLNVLS